MVSRVPAGHPLYELLNVTLTPHTAAGTRDTMEIKLREAVLNIARFFNGGRLQHEIALG